MSSRYSKTMVVEMMDRASDDISLFYKRPFINYTGRTTDTNELYTEVVAEWCLGHIDAFRKMPGITREASYKTNGHDGLPRNASSNRTEELIAMAMYRQHELPIVGTIIDYQTPLKNKRSDHTGKIDLLSFDGKTARILELKEPESDESMLRCVLEGYTYLKTVDSSKLIDDFGLPKFTVLKANPFVFYGSRQYREMQEERPKLFELIAKLGTEPLYITQESDGYGVMRG